MTAQMRAARLHEVGKPFSIDLVDKPSPRPGDVLVEVKACGVIPNFVNALDPPPQLKRPVLPAIYGLDAAGVVVEVGSAVRGVELGERVYVNPARYCLNCDACRRGHVTACEYFALNGYFGSGSKSAQMLVDYPYGGLTEYMTAPPYSLVKIPDSLSFEMAARWGYLGTGYAALQRARVDMTTSVLINGASGTLGLGATLFALALGAPLIMGVGRNLERLERVKALAPERIHVHSSTESSQPIADWARSLTEGLGAHAVIDALPTFSPVPDFVAAAAALARGGTHVNVGGVIGEIPISMFDAMNDNQTLAGNMWFTPAQGQEMADLAGSGLVKLDVYSHQVYPLEGINDSLANIKDRDGGFTNVVIMPGAQ